MLDHRWTTKLAHLLDHTYWPTCWTTVGQPLGHRWTTLDHLCWTTCWTTLVGPRVGPPLAHRWTTYVGPLLAHPCWTTVGPPGRTDVLFAILSLISLFSSRSLSLSVSLSLSLSLSLLFPFYFISARSSRFSLRSLISRLSLSLSLLSLRFTYQSTPRPG